MKQQPNSTTTEQKALCYIKLKNEKDGWAIYSATTNKEMALGFNSYQEAENHAKEYGWGIVEYMCQKEDKPLYKVLNEQR